VLTLLTADLLTLRRTPASRPGIVLRNGPTGDVRGKVLARRDPACPPFPLGIKTDLIRLGSIYALQPHMPRANRDCVPVYRARHPDKMLVGPSE
jgi:hypothetical protein